MAGTERNRQPASLEAQTLLAANRELYRAFGARDVAAMAALWAEAGEVVCIHPGWPPLVGREAVLRSWREILHSPRAPDVRCTDERLFMATGFGFVVCLEFVDGATMVATNIFAKEGRAWRLVHHQAGPVAAGESEARMAVPRGRLN